MRRADEKGDEGLENSKAKIPGQVEVDDGTTEDNCKMVKAEQRSA